MKSALQLTLFVAFLMISCSVYSAKIKRKPNLRPKPIGPKPIMPIHGAKNDKELEEECEKLVDTKIFDDLDEKFEQLKDDEENAKSMTKGELNERLNNIRKEFEEKSQEFGRKVPKKCRRIVGHYMAETHKEFAELGIKINHDKQGSGSGPNPNEE